jgi:hypothetical protein
MLPPTCRKKALTGKETVGRGEDEKLIENGLLLKKSEIASKSENRRVPCGRICTSGQHSRKWACNWETSQNRACWRSPARSSRRFGYLGNPNVVLATPLYHHAKFSA